MKKLLLNIVRKIESLKDGVIAYAYRSGNATMTFQYWEVSVSDFDLYMNDKHFKMLCEAWRKAAEAKGEKLIFVCGWVPTEEKLLELANNDNLIIDI